MRLNFRRLPEFTAGNERRVHAVANGTLFDQAPLDIRRRGDLIHDVEHHLFDDGAQGARAGAALHRFAGDLRAAPHR